MCVRNLQRILANLGMKIKLFHGSEILVQPVSELRKYLDNRGLEEREIGLGVSIVKICYLTARKEEHFE